VPDSDEWVSDLQVFVNPRIAEADGEITWKEGCLSVPGVNAEVVRCGRVVLDYLDRTGAACRLEATGLRAVCIQHELDHLEGTLYVDRLGPLEQKLTLQDYERRRTEPSAGVQ
jgi:peptide deformylase